MSFTVTVDSLEVKFKLSENISSERVLSHLRSGCRCEGGFIVNSKNEVVLEFQSNKTYKFIHFERVADVNSGVSGVVNEGETTKTSQNAQKSTTASNAKAKPVSSSSNNNKTETANTTQATVSSLASTDGANKKKEKTKRVVDPDAPKKPLTAYMMYCQDQQQLLRGKNLSMSSSEMMSSIGISWSNLKESEKAKYHAKSDADKSKYEIEKQGKQRNLNYTQRLPIYLIW